MTNGTTYICTVCNTVYTELPDTGTGENMCGRCLTTGFFQRRIIAPLEFLIDEARSHVVQADRMREVYEREYIRACERLAYIESELYMENEADYYLPDGDDFFATKQQNSDPTEGDDFEPGKEDFPGYYYVTGDVETTMPDFENE